ncbi:MAG: OmpH family outer membrane protein [Balneolales bacterium]
MIRHFSLAVTVLLLLSAAAYSQPKIGYLNPQDVLDELPRKAEIEGELNQFLDEKEAEFEEIAMEFQNDMAQFQQNQENMSEDEARREEEQLQARNQELQQYQQQIAQELQQRQTQLLQPLLSEINVAIENVAKEMELDYVLNEATGEGEMILIFVSSDGKNNLDITQQVLNLMLN